MSSVKRSEQAHQPEHLVDSKKAFWELCPTGFRVPGDLPEFHRCPECRSSGALLFLGNAPARQHFRKRCDCHRQRLKVAGKIYSKNLKFALLTEPYSSRSSPIGSVSCWTWSLSCRRTFSRILSGRTWESRPVLKCGLRIWALSSPTIPGTHPKRNSFGRFLQKSATLQQVSWGLFNT